MKEQLEKYAKRQHEQGLQQLRVDATHEAQEVFKKISKRVKGGKVLCRLCGEGKWKVHLHKGQLTCSTLDVLAPFATGMRRILGESPPLVDSIDLLILECSKCRQVLFFNTYEERKKVPEKEICDSCSYCLEEDEDG